MFRCVAAFLDIHPHLINQGLRLGPGHPMKTWQAVVLVQRPAITTASETDGVVPRVGAVAPATTHAGTAFEQTVQPVARDARPTTAPATVTCPAHHVPPFVRVRCGRT